MEFTSPKDKLFILDTFVVCTVLTILGIRVFLELTGYPQIGGNGLHIAHMLWGGLAMMVAILILLLMDKPNKLLVAVLAGVGFGFFIDEIGKFVTSDNDYFFGPTAFLIYMLLVSVWAGVRLWLTRKAKMPFLSPTEWPKERPLRFLVLCWTALSIVTGLVEVFSAFVRGNVTIVGLPNELADIIPTVMLAVTVLYISGLLQYRAGRLDYAATLIRTGAMISIIAIYPYTFFDEQFSAAVSCLITVAVVLALSEASLKQLLSPVYDSFKFLLGKK